MTLLLNTAQLTGIPVGISGCLLGQNVRYNGGHKRSAFCVDNLAEYFDFKPVCPEMAIGLGVPRPTIKLQGDFQSPRLVSSQDGLLDVTDAMVEFAEAQALQADSLSGFIFMRDSPSCGLYSTKVYNPSNGLYPKRRAGLFAEAIVAANPRLPVEEEGRLNDAVLRENFIARVFVYQALKTVLATGAHARSLVAVHSQLKFFVMAYGQPLYRTLGQLVARAGVGDPQSVWNQYLDTLMTATRKAPNKKGHTNVLFHLLGYLKKDVASHLRQPLASAIEEYRLGQVPLAVPMALVGHYLEHYASDYIRQQLYLRPYPAALGLRNAI